MGDILEQLHTHRAANGLVRSLVQRGLKHLSLGQQEAGATSIARARLCREFWLKDADVARNERMKMQEMHIILRDETEQFVKSPRVAPLFKANLWRQLGPLQRQPVYDRLRPYFERLCAERNPPWVVERAFAEPPGMEEFRKTEIKTYGAPRREGVETGEHFKD